MVQTTNGLSIASLVLGIVWVFGLGSILALIFGIVARKQIAESGGRQGGSGMALAGIILGIVGIVGLILWIVLIVAVTNDFRNCVSNPDTACGTGNSLNTGTSGNSLQSGSSRNSETAANSRSTGSTSNTGSTGVVTGPRFAFI
jgi:predicted metalloprotease